MFVFSEVGGVSTDNGKLVMRHIEIDVNTIFLNETLAGFRMWIDFMDLERITDQNQIVHSP